MAETAPAGSVYDSPTREGRATQFQRLRRANAACHRRW